MSQHLFGIQGNTAELNEHGREAYRNTLYEVETGFNSDWGGGVCVCVERNIVWLDGN